jgi:hypothetical protein
VIALNQMSFPNNPKELIRFLGAVNFYRDFILSFSSITSILYKNSNGIEDRRRHLKCLTA